MNDAAAKRIYRCGKSAWGASINLVYFEARMFQRVNLP